MTEIKSKIIRLLVIEKEEIYRCLYELLPSRGPIELVEVSAYYDISMLRHAVSTHNPEVLLLGTDRLGSNTMQELEEIRVQYPGIGMIFSLLWYSSQDIDSLRKFASKGEGGIAVFLKQSLKEIEQILDIIHAVAHGQTIVDPALTRLMFAEKHKHPLMEQLTRRELEILTLVSEGYTNAAIAKTLFIDAKTVENHLHNMYAKLRENSDFNDRHPRVTATRLCLQGTGALIK